MQEKNESEFFGLPHFSKTQLALIGILALSILLRILWLFTPVARDEGAVGYVAMVWSRGILPYQAPMAAVNPPLVYLFYMIPSYFFGNNIIPIRILNDGLFLVSLIALYVTARDWFGEKAGLISAAFYGIFMSAPIFEADLAIPSSIALPFAVLSIYLFNIWIKNQKRTALFGAGFLMSVATLILQYYIVGIGLLIASTIFVVYSDYRHTDPSWKIFAKRTLSTTLIVVIGFLVLIVALSAYFLYEGIFFNFFQATILHFTGSGYISQSEVPFSVRFLVGVEALPMWLFATVGAVFCLLRRNKYDFILIVWIAVMALISIPPPHFGRHFAQLIAPLSILSGLAIATVLKTVHVPSRSWSNLEGKVVVIFLLVTMLLATIPAFYYQSVQYPNSNFTLFGQAWTYTFSNNSAQQQELVNYIDANAGNQSVLIHGWEDELYWLTSHLAPGTRWASSYAGSGITNQAYQSILEEVNDESFRYIILMTGFPSDQIMKATAEKYFYVKSIGPYAIYDKYNSNGYYIVSSFVNDMNDSYQEYWLQNGTMGNINNLNQTIFDATVTQLSVYNQTGPAIEQIPTGYVDQQRANSSLVFTDIFIPKDCVLSFGVTLAPAAWTEKTDGVRFQVLIQGQNVTKSIFYQYVNPYQNQTDRQLYRYMLSLSQFSNENVTLSFITDAGPKGDFSYDWAYWWNPELLQYNANGA